MFTEFKLERWRQFQYVDIKLHPHLTVLTGANGAGKTTILNLLNRHFGWNLQFVSTPRRKRRGLAQFLSGLWPETRDRKTEEPPPPSLSIGEITYSDGQIAQLFVPENVQEAYEVEIRNQQTVPGMFVPSHRPVSGVYQKVEQIPTELHPREQLFQRYFSELLNFYTPRSRSMLPSFQIKQALISLATFGYGSQVVQRNEEAISTFEGFQKVLATVLPESLGFQSFEIRLPEVVLRTRSGDFSFDAVSGGVSALIDISWQIFMRSRIDEKFVVVIDEPENHLHPELQRSVLPSLVKSFPEAQFVVATHNPFIVSSVADSNVYVLDYTADRKVVSNPLDLINKAGSSNEILRDVLGLSNAMPLWVEDKVDEIVHKYSTADLNESVLLNIRAEMSEVGLGDLFSEAVTRLLDQPR